MVSCRAWIPITEKKLLKEEKTKAGKELLFDMLKRKYRLSFKKRPKFIISFNSPLFTLKIAKSDLLYNKYGFIVGKKVDKRAVVRNKLKRTVRGCIEDLFEEINTGHDFLFILKKEILNKPKEEVCLLIKNLFKKEGFIK
ncbi:ribonuclease P protein component [Candidatus Microgenomates bacterium]|nr:MAG: ribonuclease P protein component [Candidatus Microgenomates bacterium]